jgi:hypothetical protein
MTELRNWHKNEFIISIVTTIISSLLFSFIFKDGRLGLIAGLVLGFYSFILSLFNNLEKNVLSSFGELQRDQREIIHLIGINDLHSNIWLQQVLRDVASIEQKANDLNHQIVKQYVKDEIGRNINDLHTTFHTGTKKYYEGWDHETERQIWLRNIIQGSKLYVKAVTSYDPIYWKNFWGRPNFSQEYVHANISAAERGVKVERIFILSDEILNGSDKYLCSLIQSFVKPMLDKSANLKTLFASSSQIPPSHSNYKTSNFLFSDNAFVGFLDKFSEEDKSSGFIAILDQKELQKCDLIYQTLKRYAINPCEFPFMQDGD